MMGVIKNSDQLGVSAERKAILQLIEEAFSSIQPDKVLASKFRRDGNMLHIGDQTFDLQQFNRVFVIAFGKGSAGIAKIVESSLLDKIADGYVIDNVEQQFSKLHFTLGTHPLPSQQNIDFTETVLRNITGLTEKDLVLVIICGGGSAMFEAPAAINLETLTSVFSALLKSGATISEMNIVRKHLSKVKGGGLAKHLFPATIASLIFSDVPGSTLSVIASGPTVLETATQQDALAVMQKYNLSASVTLPIEKALGELPKDPQYFQKVFNILIVSNQTALDAMSKKATELGLHPRIFSDKFQGDAKQVGKDLLAECKNGEVLLVGGETTVHVTGTGKGGRNQSLVVAALPYIHDGAIIASFDSDGQDFYYFAGAIGDEHTVIKAIALGLDPKSFLDDDNSYEFLQKVGDGIFTDKLESNVSDLMIVFKP